MNHLLGLDRLKSLIPQSDGDYMSLLSLEARLLDCLDQETMVGPSETSRAEKARILTELNALAIKNRGFSFNDLCSTSFGPRRIGLAAVHNLPQPGYGRFIGREREVGSLLTELSPYPRGQWPVVVVHGIGGSGKTTLVLETAWRLVDTYKDSPSTERFDAIVWVTAKEKILTGEGVRPLPHTRHYFRNISDILEAVARTLGYSAIESEESGKEADVLYEMLSKQRSLLVVDNLETVDDARIETFLRNPPCKIIVTSRHKLEGLPGLAFRLSGMPRKECLDLIERECLKEEHNKVTLKPLEAEVLTERSGGMPLAVVWSVGLVRNGYDVDTVLQRLGEADADIVRFCFDYSMDVVRQNLAAHRLLMALALVELDASRLMLGVVTGLNDERVALIEALNKLERLSLINRHGDRYSMLPLTRAYVSNELKQYSEFQNSVAGMWRLSDDRAGSLEGLWTGAVYALENGALDEFEATCRKLAQSLCESLDTVLITDNPIRSNRFLGYVVSAQPVFPGIGVPDEVPLLFFKDSSLVNQDANEIHEITRLVGRFPSSLVILIPFFGRQDKEDARILLRDQLRAIYAVDTVLLTRDDAFRMMLARNPRDVFRKFVLAQVDLRVIDPYIVVGPTSDYMLFGREPELREITEHIHQASYAITGGRRVGKTSMLRSLHRARLPAAGFRTLYHDCAVASTYETLITQAVTNWQPEQPPEAPSTFGDLLQSPPNDKPLVLLLDEADRLVSIDRENGWQLFKTLRALADSKRVQVVLGGERTLRDALKDPGSPLFSFAKEMLIGRLDYRAVEELVTRPMKLLEIELVDESALVKRIWELTSGHPNVVQRLCRRLLEQLNKRDMRRLTVDDVETVSVDRRFQTDDFLSTYWQGATPLEELVSLLMSEAPTCRTLTAIQGALNRLGIYASLREIDDVLQRLVDLRSLLKRTADGYEFAALVFPEVLGRIFVFSDIKAVLVEQARTEQLEKRPQFQVGGALESDSPLYIERDADRMLLHLVSQMEYVLIAEPRQTGKTSLLNHLSRRLPSPEVAAVYIDVTTLDLRSESAWYTGLTQRIARQLAKADVTLSNAVAQPSHSSGWSSYLEDLAATLTRQQTRLLIILDEVGALALPWSGGFFSVLRSVYNSRQSMPALRNLTFLLAGAFHPRSLIEDDRISPFNIAQRVRLADFTEVQLTQLVGELNLDEIRTHDIAARIFHWTQGHPYLCQLICRYLSEIPEPTLLDVDSSAARLLVEDVNHLPPMLSKLEQDPKLLPYLSRMSETETPYSPSVNYLQAQLDLLGVIRADPSGKCTVRNRVYEMAIQPYLRRVVTSRRLVDFLEASFSEEALAGLCFAFGIKYQSLDGSEKQSHIRSFVETLQSQGRLEELAKIVDA